MHVIIPPSAEVVLTEDQAAWDTKRERADFWLSFMSRSVCLIALAPVAGFSIWAGEALVDVITSMNREPDAMIALLYEAGERTAVAMLATIVVAALFELARDRMDKVRWHARERLGARPSENDAQADNYELVEVDVQETETGIVSATVNGWQFTVAHKVNRVANGEHRMDFSFTEVNGREGLSFGSSAVMDEFHRETKHEIIKTILSKMVHVYPELKNPPPVDYYA